MDIKHLRDILICGDDLPDFDHLYFADKRVNYLFSGRGVVDKRFLIDQLNIRVIDICRYQLKTYNLENLKTLAELTTLLEVILSD